MTTRRRLEGLQAEGTLWAPSHSLGRSGIVYIGHIKQEKI